LAYAVAIATSFAAVPGITQAAPAGDAAAEAAASTEATASTETAASTEAAVPPAQTAPAAETKAETAAAVEAAPAPDPSVSGMEDRTETFILPDNGQWEKTFSNLPTYDAEGNLFIYWFEETDTTNADGYFPVTVNGADHPLDVDQSTQVIKNLKKAAIKIIKVMKGTETGIQGAKFTLTQVDEEGHVVPGGIVKPEVSTDGNGIIIFDNLEPGRYELEETKVPDGYIKNEGPYYIIVNNDYTTTLDTSVAHTLITKAETSSIYTVQNEPCTALPNTGGPGTSLFYLLGIMLTCFSGGGIVMRRKRRTA
jgi:LPXTG-motif cell wall-anchored protein